MKKIEEHVLKILNQFGIDPQRACWDCRGTLVIYHRYLERIADKAGITFDDPDVKVLDLEKGLVCMFVRGHLGENSAWSFGEVTPKNCKNEYPVAMSEKRAKDRVILKLAGLSGHVYSEEEADEFKKSAPNRPSGGDAPKPKASTATEISLPKEPPVAVPPPRKISQGAPPPYERSGPPVEVKSANTGADPIDVIRNYLVECGGEASRGAILKATGLTIGVFNGAISRLRDSGEVAMFGQKRGAKWRLLSGMTVGEGDPAPAVEQQAPPLEAVPDIVQPEEPSVPQAGTLATEDMVREFTDGIMNSGVNFIELANVTREFTGFPSVREAHAHNVMTVEAMDKIRSALAR